MNRRLSFPLILLAASVSLAGCHTVKSLVPPVKDLVPPNLRAPENTDDPIKQAEQRLKDATPCCTNYADFSYQTMLPWQPQPFTLGPGSSVASIGGTHTYFLAFQLPVGAKLPYRVAFKSELNGRWLKSSYLFAPTVVLLDSGFQPLAPGDDVSLCEHMGWSNEASGAFGSFTVKNKQARYLLIYSSAEQQKGKTYWEQSPAAFSSKATLDMSSSGTFSVPHGPDGTIWVGMMDTTYAKAVDNAICKKPDKGDGVLNTLRDTLPLPWSTANDTGKSGTSGSNASQSNSDGNSSPSTGKGN